MALSALAPAGGATAKPVSAARRGGVVALALLIPGLAYLALFFLVPFVSLVMTSFGVNDPNEYGVFSYGFQWQNYVDAISSYWPQFLRSFWFALLATVFALLISYPIAYFIGVRLRERVLLRNLLLVLVIAPFFISFLLRTLAWKQILSDEGPVVSSLQFLGLMGSQDHLTGTAFSVVFGLTYNFVPFMTLPLFASLERLDKRLLEAGSDLYASPATTFWRVTFPLTLPGVVSGTLLTFIPAAGDYVNASQSFLGSASTSMIGNVIQSNFLITVNYPQAAALSILLMLVIVVIVGIYVRRSGTEDLL
ncbi:MAG: ABC transporter permease [Microbacterium sp.]|jgi:spermidine/putrescine transport system permease protein|uniref:ABC transporter permease n=2 Tax=Bacteria TaxID=2 RepID=A0A0F0LTN0_9MICO|nr:MULTISPECIES: ABC transporter permease [Microbacterium]MAL06989.1 ABC transporter permease [Microbacterium sp.]MCK9914931.1 ABC transporter permease [Microbacteriaceae bacterium K1510]KJL35630.1 Spermidine/putrescine transport system permease protein PotB [Microbacterium ginsengisoli]KQS00163.1 ABC transporter permease [Microbacterium sp. Leaf347]KQS02806.1 ABC transporter permease [Microbacterium sp. Leaf351]